MNELLELKESHELNDYRKVEREDSAETLYTTHTFVADINTLVHYFDNVSAWEDTLLAKLVPSVSRKASGIEHYIYRHTPSNSSQACVGALIYVNGWFSAHLHNGWDKEALASKKFLADMSINHFDAKHPDTFYMDNQLEHFVDFFIDDDEDTLVKVDLAPGMYDRLEKEINAHSQEENVSPDSYIFDGLYPSIEALTALLSKKEIETTFNKYSRIKRIDPYLTMAWKDEEGEQREKLKMTLETFAVSEENQRYVINVTPLQINELIAFRYALLNDKQIGEEGAEGFDKVYGERIIQNLAYGSEHSYVVGVIESNNGNFNVNYDAGQYKGYTYKQSARSPFSYVVLMDKEDIARGFENILVIYDDFGHSFTQPLSKENADIVFKQLVGIRPNLHEDYVDGHKVKEVHPRGETPYIQQLDESPFMSPPVEDLEDD